MPLFAIIMRNITQNEKYIDTIAIKKWTKIKPIEFFDGVIMLRFGETKLAKKEYYDIK